MGSLNTVTSLIFLSSVLISSIHSQPYFLSTNTNKYQETRQGLFNHFASTKAYSVFNPTNCSLHPALVNEIASYQSVVNDIILASMVGSFQGKTYKNLSDFVDTFGSRIQGSDNLEEAIDDLKAQMIKYGFTNVRTEDVRGSPNWKR